jgi:hypothetical protein
MLRPLLCEKPHTDRALIGWFALTITPMTDDKPKGGRPPKPEAERRSVVVALRLTPDLAAKRKRLGGVDWLRERLQRAREK